MKKLCIALALILVLSFALVSCRGFDTNDGMYGYYNENTTDRDYNERRNETNTERKIRDSYERAKNNVKNTIDSAAEYLSGN